MKLFDAWYKLENSLMLMPSNYEKFPSETQQKYKKLQKFLCIFIESHLKKVDHLFGSLLVQRKEYEFPLNIWIMKAIKRRIMLPFTIFINLNKL